jgi:phosphoribosylformylglycinamidine (FGAM) synthase PurS component
VNSQRLRIAMTLFKRYDAKEIYAYFLKAFHEQRFGEDGFENLSKVKEAFFAILSPHDDLKEEFMLSFLRWIEQYVPKQRIDRCLATLRQIRANRKNEVQSVKLPKTTYIDLKNYADFYNLSLQNAIDLLLKNTLIHQTHITEDKKTIMTLEDEDCDKTIEVKLEFIIENNSRYLRGKKKAISDIENELFHFDHRLKTIDDGHYILTIDYKTDYELERFINKIDCEICKTAEIHDCFIATIDFSRLDGELFSFQIDEEDDDEEQ